MPKLRKDHIEYLTKRGVKTEPPENNYFSDGCHLGIRYLDPEGNPYMDSKGDEYIVRRLFPTGKPKFKAPTGSGSRPYFSPIMPDGYLEDINIPLVLIEGPVKVDACYQAIPTGFCFVGLTGTWNIVDRRGEDGEWNPENDTRVLPELKAIPMKGRQVIVLFDSDIADNRSVSKAAKAIGNWSRGRGASPSRVNLPNEANGDKNGADDFLVRHGADQLVERLLTAKIIGYPLPSPLLTDDGDIRHDLDPTEIEEAINAVSLVSDVNVLDQVVRRLSQKLRRKYDELLALVDDARSGNDDLGFLCSDDDLKQSDVDSKWIVPDVLPRGELVVFAADSGAGKSLLVYDLCRALIKGDKWLGFSVPKMRCLILQLEEGGTMASRLTAFGFHHWSKRGEGWEAGQSFDLAKPRHRQQLSRLIESGFEFVMVDPLRAVSSLDVDENGADIGKKVLRPLRKLITEAGASAVVIHHNSRHSGKYAGNGDIKAAAWGLFSLRRIQEGNPDELHLSSLEIHDGKCRDGDPILWRIKKERCEGFDGGQSNCEWFLLSMEQHDCPDLPLVKRFEAQLATESEPRTLRQIGESLGLLPDGTKVNSSLRVMAAKTAIVRRWAIKEPKKTTVYWMPFDRRPESIQQGLSIPPLKTDNQLTHPSSQGKSRVNQGLDEGLHPRKELTVNKTELTQGNPENPCSKRAETLVNPENPCFDSRVNSDHPGSAGIESVSKGTPVYVDQENGWISPSGIIRGHNVTLVDPSGQSRLIASKRVSLHPPPMVDDHS